MRRVQYIFLSALAAVLLIMSHPARAVVIKDLYEALIPVRGQSLEERNEALSAGLVEVLTRVSGRTLVVGEDPENPILLAIQNPTRYTRQFVYRKAGKGIPGLHLWVKYDDKAVNNLLQSNNLPVWGHTRPTTLAWVVVTEGGRRKLLSNSENHAAKGVLKHIANRRGLPLNFPLMDLTDREKISISDVWGNFEDRISKASQRYNAEAVIVGRLYKGVTDEWSARWSIYHQGRRQDLNVDGEKDLNLAIIGVVAQVSETLAQQFALLKSEESSEAVLVQINGVGSLKTFNRIVKYLKSLAAVSEVSPVIVREEAATFKLTTRGGGRLALAQAIKLGHILAEQLPAADMQLPASGGPDLVYQLIQ